MENYLVGEYIIMRIVQCSCCYDPTTNTDSLSLSQEREREREREGKRERERERERDSMTTKKIALLPAIKIIPIFSRTRISTL